MGVDSLKLFTPRSFRSGLGFATLFLILGKSVGYTRQLAVAYYFGVSRSLDIYFMAHAITMLLIFFYTTWFDQLAIPHLVKIMEKEGDLKFHELTGSIF